MPVVPDAYRTERGYYEARPADVLGAEGIVVLDVRGEGELLGPSGHIHGVLHVPLERVLGQGEPDLPLDTPIAVVCEMGSRSATGARALVERGFSEVYNLVGGMRRWTMEDRPVARVRTWRTE
ncbi:MAG: rhodanese-like domain-containing protein [Polyangiales bacterium]|nr:rhodanese-like domain-containing protein [Myxococcales bacterium]